MVLYLSEYRNNTRRRSLQIVEYESLDYTWRKRARKLDETDFRSPVIMGKYTQSQSSLCVGHISSKGPEGYFILHSERERTVRSNVTDVVFGETFEGTFKIP